MIIYNLMAEYASLLVAVAILISFSRDYERQSASGQVLRVLYGMVILTSIVTIATTLWDVPGFTSWIIARNYIANTLYYTVLPSSTLCLLLYVITLTKFQGNETDLTRKLFPYTIPYLSYLLILFTNISNNKVFFITPTAGYVRGEWFQIPFVIGTVYVLWVFYVVCCNRKMIRGDAGIVIAFTILLDLVAMYIQFKNPNTIMTGLFNTLTMLTIHLYVQNVSKSTDSLTGVLNRSALRHRLNQRITRKEQFSLYVFSLRGFKTVNQRHGLEVGDQVLIAMSRILTSIFSKVEVFRYNGDEFALMLGTDVASNEALIGKLLPMIDRPLRVDGIDISLDIVYARVDYPSFGEDVKSLISAADYSISLLKEDGGDMRYLYDTTVVEKMTQRAKTLQRLKSAIADDRFVVHYQPIYSSRDNAFTQAEALVRMIGRDGKLIYPNDFIDLAEKTGLIIPMTYLVLEHVCADLRTLIDSHGSQLLLGSISVNFPYLQFTTSDMERRIDEILEKYNIPSSMIKIEITERALVADAHAVKSTMLRMNSEGFYFELDDFGVEYSNIHTFLSLPLTIIKLDRSLLLSACETPQNTAFFQHLVAGIHGTDRITIVEGVEEHDQLSMVLDCGCEYVQGYIFSKPLPFDAFSSFVEPEKQRTMLEQFQLLPR